MCVRRCPVSLPFLHAGLDGSLRNRYPMSCPNVGCDVLGGHAILEELDYFVFVGLLAYIVGHTYVVGGIDSGRW